MGEGGGRRRVGQIVRRHVDRLHRGDRSLLGAGDPLFQGPEIGRQGRLVADRRWDASQQRRDFGPCLGKAEDVVDEEQHILALLVAEIFGEGEAAEADTGARPGRLVHLAVDEGRLGARPVGGDDPGFHHFVIEVVALAGALTDPGEHRIAAMRLGDVVDQFHDDDGLADPGAAEQANLATLGVWRQQVDDLDPGDQDLGFGRLVDQLGRRAVDWQAAVGHDRTALVHGVADHVEDAAQGLGANRHHDRLARIDRLGAAHQAVGRVHRDRAHDVLAELLRHFEDQRAAGVVDGQRVQDLRQFTVEMDIDDGADDLGDAADAVSGHVQQYPYSISIWRRRVFTRHARTCCGHPRFPTRGHFRRHGWPGQARL